MRETLERALLDRVDMLDQSFLVLRARQVGCAAARLHEALEPKRDADTRLIQAWTIQPQSHRKIKAGGHLEVLKLSTIFREVQRLRLHQQASTPRAAVELEIFPSLRAIEVLHTQAAALRHVHYFARQLRFLHIEQTDMDSLRQVLAPPPSNSSEGGSGTNDGANRTHAPGGVVWRRLETLQINCCALLAVDSSVNHLRVIRHLDLGWNSIQAFDEPLAAASLEVLHLCHNRLCDVPPIQSLRGLRELDLSVNKIASLRGLEALAALEVLDVSHNSVHCMADVELLVGLTKLRRLVLQHNPIARRPDYRREVLFYLGDGVELDREPWSAAELLSMNKSRQSTAESRSESADWGVPPIDDDDDADEHGELFRTVDDYFTTQSDFIVVLDQELVDARVEHANDSSGDDSDDSNGTGRRSRKYTTSDFMRDFEEEELLIRDGAIGTTEVDVVSSRAVARSRRGKQTGDAALTVRVLLGADEASRFDLVFGKDGVAAALDVKTHEIIEIIHPSDRETPLRIHRNLPDLVAIGSSIHTSGRAKIVTLRFRMPTSGTLSVTYQIDAAASLERVLAAVIGYLHQYQQKTPPVICVCANCGAVSHLSREFLVQFAATSPLWSGPTDPFIVYACLLCNSYNVRETSFEKMIAVYSVDGVPLSAKRLATNPLLLPEKLADDGFYIEEIEIDAADAAAMHECVLISSNGVREVAAPSSAAHSSALSDDAPNDAREEAIVQAITMK
ncbi:hypothetical protein PybrP1_003938 [[Pythium] brassicae (nom. inval.)]|nr:hypothetical protein PybrP1_003938 [[Pythium] brassicae (nom. inval.)]